MSPLPPIMDADKPCPKCGWAPVSLTLCNKRFSIGYGEPAHALAGGEHIDRHCQRCGARWLELPLDSTMTEEKWKKGISANFGTLGGVTEEKANQLTKETWRWSRPDTAR